MTHRSIRGQIYSLKSDQNSLSSIGQNKCYFDQKARIEAENKELRGKLLEQMKSQAVEVRDVEEKVYVVGCKLKRVLDENDRFSTVRLNIHHFYHSRE